MSSFRVKLTLALAAAVKDAEIRQGYEAKAKVLAKLDDAENRLFAERAKIIEDRIRPGDDPHIKACRSIENEISGINFELSNVERKLYSRLGNFPEEMERTTLVVETFTMS